MCHDYTPGMATNRPHKAPLSARALYAWLAMQPGLMTAPDMAERLGRKLGEVVSALQVARQLGLLTGEIHSDLCSVLWYASHYAQDEPRAFNRFDAHAANEGTMEEHLNAWRTSPCASLRKVGA